VVDAERQHDLDREESHEKQQHDRCVGVDRGRGEHDDDPETGGRLVHVTPLQCHDDGGGGDRERPRDESRNQGQPEQERDERKVQVHDEEDDAPLGARRVVVARAPRQVRHGSCREVSNEQTSEESAPPLHVAESGQHSNDRERHRKHDESQRHGRLLGAKDIVKDAWHSKHRHEQIVTRWRRRARGR
jgi:hypothetical protein